MGMKLLTPTEAQKRVRSDDALKAVRRKEMSDAVTESAQSLANLEGDFQKLLASQRARWALEENEHIGETKRRKEEIEILERERAPLLIPIAELEKKAENTLQEAQIVLMRANEKEEHNDRMASVLERRLDGVSERELAATTKENQLDRREKGVVSQETLTSSRARQFSEASERFVAASEKREAGLKQKERGLELREINLSTREAAVTRREEQFVIDEANLRSRYKALEEATKEVNKKK